MSGKEFPNNWDEINDADPEQFETCTFDEFMVGMRMWRLPSSHSFLMRVYNRDTNKVPQSPRPKQDHHAKKRLMKECQNSDNEIILCDNYSIHLIQHGNERSDD